MQEVFEKLKQRIRICATEACGYTPLTRVVSEAELKEIIEQIAAEYSNGHFGCNTNGEHERCDGCGLMDCKSRNKIWFGAGDDDTDINVGSNEWIPCSERLLKLKIYTKKALIIAHVILSKEDVALWMWHTISRYMENHILKQIR